jgi:hypothetical protein
MNDAYMVLRPEGSAPPNGGTVSVGTRFVLGLSLNTGSHNDVAAAQNYLLFDDPASPSSVLKVVPITSTNCSSIPVSTTVTPDTTMFETVLQNEVCNGPGACSFRGIFTPPGYLAYASGALTNCPSGCGPGDFRVARIGLCAVNPGRATLHWQFSPPDPPTRDTEIVDVNSQPIHNRALYVDYVINVVAPTQTPTPTPTVCTMTFTDVQPSDYFYQPVLYLYCHGVISGYGDNTFRPYNNTTRGQLAKIVVLAEGWTLYTPPTPTFQDVPSNHSFYQYVETAYHHGIISGYGDGTFHPENGVTRGQLCKIVVLAAGWPIYTPPTPSFDDVPADSPFYGVIETAYYHQIISGYLDRTFRPSNSATRGQICKIVYLAVMQ